MARRTPGPRGHGLKVAVQTVICGAGLLGGLVIGAAAVYFSGLWLKFTEALKTPLGSMSKSELIVLAATLVIVFGCGWLGARWGMAQAARIGS